LHGAQRPCFSSEEKKPGKEKPSPKPETAGDFWELDARRMLAGRSPKTSPWGTGDTWDMNTLFEGDFWHSSPWGTGDTWELKALKGRPRRPHS
jgi:hypothetical protein